MNKKILLTIIFIGTLGAALLAYFYQSPTVLKTASYQTLPGWQNSDVHTSFEAFKVSCTTFLRQNPDQFVGSPSIPLKVKDWRPICLAANQLTPLTDINIKHFFQHWFQPVEFYSRGSKQGLFTGYYLPLVEGSLVKTAEFGTPIYGLPDDLITINPQDYNPKLTKKNWVGRVKDGKLVPYYSRSEINKGAIKHHAAVLLWVKNPVDRLFLEIQGSGKVKLTDGKILFVGYAGENGAPYTPVGRILINKKIMTKENASMQKIKAYLEQHPEQIPAVINQNQSFVFFRFLKQTAALGAQGVTLTPGYSLAVDRKWIPLGIPLWLDTTHPQVDKIKPHSLQRLMIAQDTGGAIRGMVRGDVFWGAGEKATYIAGNMKNSGHYWLLIPKHCMHKMATRLKID